MNFNEKTIKTWGVELTARKKRIAAVKDINRYISRRCTINSTIYNCDNATQPHTQQNTNSVNRRKLSIIDVYG